MYCQLKLVFASQRRAGSCNTSHVTAISNKNIITVAVVERGSLFIPVLIILSLPGKNCLNDHWSLTMARC